MKRKKTRKGGDWYLFFLPLLQGMGIMLLVIAVMCGATLIILNADKLHWFFMPVFLAYFSVIAALAGWIYTRRARNYLHMMMGDELFYKTYAFDRWLLKCRKRREKTNEKQELSF